MKYRIDRLRDNESESWERVGTALTYKEATERARKLTDESGRPHIVAEGPIILAHFEPLQPKPYAASALGVKHDTGKPDWTLVPFEALEGAVRVMQHVIDSGEYKRDSWKHVDDAVNRYTKAALRHIFADLRGEERDPKTGELHIDHLLCCLLFRRWHELQQDKRTE